MKKIYLIGIAASLLVFSSCSETWDGNPVLKTHEGTPTLEFLNAPTMQDQTIMLTEENAIGSLHLTCSQPDYGYAAVVSYKVQCSLTKDFTELQEIDQSFYDCSQINPQCSDVAAAIEYLSGVKTEDDLPLPYQRLYVRLKAFIEQNEAGTTYYSNEVYFDKISANYLAIWVSDVPVGIYMRGGMNGWGAEASYQFVTGPEKNTWVLKNATIDAGVEFKFADANWGDINLGGGDSSVIEPGKLFSLSNNGSNLSVKEDFKGLIQLSLENGIYSVLLDPAQ